MLQQVLGDDWAQLGSVIRKHYTLRAFSTVCITVEGEMDTVWHSRIGALLLPLGCLMGSVVPFQGKRVPVSVHCRSVSDDATLLWDRVFRFPGRKPFHLRSRMTPMGTHEVVEWVRFGVGMRLRVAVEEGALVLRDNGYLWRLGGCNIPLPGRWLFGRASIEEWGIDARCFRMRMELRHAWFGVLFAFRGTFSLPGEPVGGHEVHEA